MIEILFQDSRYVAVHKPPGMLIHRNSWCPHEPACLELLRDQIGAFVYPVHRLDRGTSGVLVFALDTAAAAGLAAMFRQRKVHKSYLAVVRGFLDAEGRFDDALKRQGGRASIPAITEFRLQGTVELQAPVGRYSTARYSLVRATPRTGRHHQIRRHFAHASHPVIGDRKHGDKAHNLFFCEQLGVARLLLMATDIAFRHPFDDSLVHIHAPLPPEVNDLFSRLGWPVEPPRCPAPRAIRPLSRTGLSAPAEEAQTALLAEPPDHLPAASSHVRG